MAREPLIDVSTLDPHSVIVPQEEVRKFNQQRFEMEQLDGLIYFDPEARLAVGVRHVKEDEFWVRGHVPGRPLLPGVLLVEAAAQLCSWIYRKALAPDDDGFMGFAGLEDVRFMGMVVPGDTLVLVARPRRARPRLAIFETQAFVGTKLVFEGVVKGSPM